MTRTQRFNRTISEDIVIEGSRIKDSAQDDLREAFAQIRDYKEKKIQLQTLSDFINELWNTK